MITIAEISPPPACPLGPMTAGVTDAGVCLLTLTPLTDAAPSIESARSMHGGAVAEGEHPILDRLRHELDAYFEGHPGPFTVPVDAPGTPWERRVWESLVAIPAGQTRTYGQIARDLGNPGGSRAVGLANRRNRLAILIPCHRVVASDGSLHGYAGGLERKRWLLDHERAMSPQPGLLFGSGQERLP